MIPIEKKSRGGNNVTNLNDVRQAKAMAQSQDNTEATDNSVNGSHADVLAKPKASDEHGNRRFDAEKVARIKAAIAAGEYEINPARIADRFIEHDRNQ